MVERYAAGEGSGEEDEGKAFVSLNWLLSEEHMDLETELAWGFLDYLLLGTSAAPLRKALNDSGLGEALIGGRPSLVCIPHCLFCRHPSARAGCKHPLCPDALQVSKCCAYLSPFNLPLAWSLAVCLRVSGW